MKRFVYDFCFIMFAVIYYATFVPIVFFSNVYFYFNPEADKALLKEVVEGDEA